MCPILVEFIDFVVRLAECGLDLDLVLELTEFRGFANSVEALSAVVEREVSSVVSRRLREEKSKGLWDAHIEVRGRW